MSNIDVNIGKFVLDSLTIGMYEDPIIIYREYIQNATDAIDDAIELGFIKSKEESTIDINIDENEKSITIKDNGCGIKSCESISRLCDVGNSQKSYDKKRGFRGIGRLAGVAYCDRLTFITSYKGEDKKSIITWDCIKLKQLLEPGKYKELDLVKVIELCVEAKFEDENIDTHYFEVKLDNVDYNLNLLKEPIVKDYVTQVAPIEIDSTMFKYYVDTQTGIEKFMKENNIPIEEYPIRLNNEYITKQYKMTLKDKNNKPIDNIVGVKKQIITNDDGKNGMGREKFVRV